MSEALEMAIRDMLISEGSVDRVAKSLLKRLTLDATPRSESSAFIHFLILAGYYKEVLGLFGIWFKQKHSFSLMAFCYILNRSGFKPSEEFIENLFKLSEKLEPQDQLTHFIPWENLNSKFLITKESTVEKLEALALQRKEKFLEKLEYLRTNRMIEEEEKLLSELIYAYPEEPQFIKEKEKFKERWAHAVLARKSYQKLDEHMLFKARNLTAEEQEIVTALVGEMKKIARRNTDLAYNFSIGLFFLELYTESSELLSLAPSTVPVDWFNIELLIAARRYVECLDALVSLEKKYASDPETTFGSTYYRALALDGLGQIAVATQLLKSIVSIRPNYRSAHSLLQKLEGMRP